MVHHGHPVHEAQDHVHVVLHHHHGAAAVPVHPPDDRGEGRDVPRRHPGHRLVQEHDGGIRRQQHGDLHLALLAVREVPRRRRELAGEPDLRDGAAGNPGGLVGGGGEAQEAEAAAEFRLGGEPDVFQHAEPGKQVGGLEGPAQPGLGPAVDGRGRDLPAVQRDAARGGPHHAGDQVEQGGLAGAVGADHADHFAGADGEAHILEDAGTADLQAEAVHRKGGQGWGIHRILRARWP